jgi:hypothetical protein
MLHYGDCISIKSFQKAYQASQKRNELANRTKYDAHVDYSGKSLDLRNNPWFFGKNYNFELRPEDGIYP